MKFRKSILAVFMAFLLFSLQVFATEPIDKLESETSDLQNDLSNLNQELQSLSDDLDSITAQIQATASELQEIKESLAIAKGEEKAQYEAMNLRIKYLYENGNSSILEMLFSSRSLAEFLNHAEYYAAIMDYDRALLEELERTSAAIAQEEEALLEKQADLQALQSKLDEKEALLNQKISDTSADLSEYQAKLDAAKAAAEEAEESAQEEIIPIEPEPEPEPEPEKEPEVSEPEVSEPEEEEEEEEKPSYSATASDLELFAALIECEAGSRDYEGMLAVASVVVNRMNSRYYPDTLRGVIFQSGQFPPATNGKVDRVLERGVKDSCLTVAQDALNGKNNVGDCLQFRAASSGHAGIIIGDNVFF